MSTKKLRKENAAKKKKGDAWIPDDQYAAKHGAAAQQGFLSARIARLQMPTDAYLSAVCEGEPEWHRYLFSGKVRVTDNSNKLQPQIIRAIWYNALDKTHTFNWENARCKAATAVLIYMINEHGPKSLSNLQSAYYLAVIESRNAHEAFTYRELFLKLWIERADDEDIPVLTKGQMATFKGLRKPPGANGMGEMRDTSAANGDDSEDEDKIGIGAQDTNMADLGEELGDLMATGSDNKAQLLDDPEYIAGLASFDTEEDKDGFQADHCLSMLESVQKRMDEYYASTDKPDLKVIDAIIAPLEAAVGVIELERGLRSLMMGGPVGDAEMEG